MSLNQFRLDLGVKFGDPRILPHGKAQNFASSVIVYMKSTTIEDDAQKAESATVQISGLCHKNKTYVPKLNFTFKMGLKDGEELKKGEIDNLTQMMRAVKRCGLMVKVKTKTVLLGEEFNTQKEVKAKLAQVADSQRFAMAIGNGAAIGRRVDGSCVTRLATGLQEILVQALQIKSPRRQRHESR